MSYPQIQQIRVITFDFRVTTTFIKKKKNTENFTYCVCAKTCLIARLQKLVRRSLMTFPARPNETTRK